jgi:hypothetical protein
MSLSDSASLVPLTKVHLREALATSDDSRASDLLWWLHESGWPLARSLPSIRDAAEGRATAIPATVLKTIDEIRHLERSARGVGLLVNDINQRRLGHKEAGCRAINAARPT